jgi:hypothetical protein
MAMKIDLRSIKVGNVVGEGVGWMRPLSDQVGVGVCGHGRCKRPATEGEAFRIKTPPSARYRTRVVWFWRCEKHEHSHWKQIGYPAKKA